MRFLYQAMIRAPGWLLDENIHFENALGEIRSLPFAYFRHKKVRIPDSNLPYISTDKGKVFEAFLEADFKGKPGGFQVALHHYQILTPGGTRLNGSSWTTAVRQGAHVYMSINIPRNVDEIMPGNDSLQRRRTAASDQKYSSSAVWKYKTWYVPSRMRSLKLTYPRSPDCGLQFFSMPKVGTEEESERTLLHSATTLRSEIKFPREVQWPATTDGAPSPRLQVPSSQTKSRLLSLASEDALPFKRMHVFGR